MTEPIEDGEDTQRRQRHSVAIRLLEDGDEEYKLNCICTLLESQQELASLREQLKQERNKVIDEFYNLMDKELQTEPINRARYMNRLFEFKEFLKDKSHE